jgi:acyl-CoA dehydrogenase
MLTLKPELTLPAAGLTGFEVPLSEEERAIQDTVHQFARNVMRPIGRELDRMSAADVCAPSSPFWSVFQERPSWGSTLRSSRSSNPVSRFVSNP